VNRHAIKAMAMASKGDEMKQAKFLIRILGAAAVVMASSVAHAQLCTVGRNVDVLWKGSWYKAKITEAKPDLCKVAYDGYTKDDDEWVDPTRLKIKVLWKGEWYPAKALRKDGNNYQVSYDGYGSEDNEIVPLSRIQLR
jgi:hypothetical protein